MPTGQDVVAGHGGRPTGQSGVRDEAPSRRSATQAPPVRRTPQGPDRQHTNDKHRPIRGRREACRARPGFETTRRAESSQRRRRAGGQATRRPEIRRARNANGTTSNASNPAHTAARPDNAQNTTGTTSTMSRKATTNRHTQQPGPTMPGTPATPQAAPEEQAAPGTPAVPQAPQHISRNRSTSAGAAGTAEFTRRRGGRLRA